MTPTIYTAEQIADAGHAAGIPPSADFMSDSRYVMLTPDDVQVKLAKVVSSFIKQLGITFEDETFDCDDFTILSAAVARILHRQQNRGLDAGVAYGEIWCAAIQHAFAKAHHAGAGGVNGTVKFYEPQLDAFGFSMKEISLGVAERKTIWLNKT